MESRLAIFDDTSGKFSLHKTTIPSLLEGEILVKISYTTICRSDIYTYQGSRKEKSPTILGHEIVGRIIEFADGANKTDLRGHYMSIGDRITWAIYASDPNSIYALKGIPQKSELLFKYGHEQLTDKNTLHGGLADYIILRPNTPIVKLMDFIPDPIAALINCSFATVAGGFRLADKVKDKTVLVNGTGMLGTIACAMASHGHAKRIIAVDISEERVNRALQFGADIAVVSNDTHTIQEQINAKAGQDVKIDVVMEFSGLPTAMSSTLNLLDIGGIAVWIGATFPQTSFEVNGEMIVRRLLSIKGLHNYNEKDLITAVAFIESCYELFDFQSMIEGGFKLEEVNKAFEYALNKNPFRVGIDFSNVL